LQTSDLLNAVHGKDKGLGTSGLLSHSGVYELPNYRLIDVHHDGGIIIAPDLKQRKQFLSATAVDVARHTGGNLTKVAVLAAVEKVNPATAAYSRRRIFEQDGPARANKNCGDRWYFGHG
jgi:phosphate butyryltransferase